MKEQGGKFTVESICGTGIELTVGRKDLTTYKASSQPEPKGFYVYAHRDRKRGQNFYIGKGKEWRAWNTDRDPIWSSYVEYLHNQYDVVILADGLTEEDALSIENAYVADQGLHLVNWSNYSRLDPIPGSKSDRDYSLPPFSVWSNFSGKWKAMCVDPYAPDKIEQCKQKLNELNEKIAKLRPTSLKSRMALEKRRGYWEHKLKYSLSRSDSVEIFNPIHKQDWEAFIANYGKSERG